MGALAISTVPARTAVAALAALACITPTTAWAQLYSSNTSTDFPTWERDVDSSEVDPLPVGRPGSYEARFAVDVGGAPLGVAGLFDGTVVVLTADGRATWLAADGSQVAAHATDVEPVHAPVGALDGVVLSGSRGLALVRRDGVAWRVTADGPDDREPHFAALGRGEPPRLVVRSRGDHRVEWLDAATGTSVGIAEKAEPTRLARPALLPPSGGSGGVVISGNASGEIFALDLTMGANGRELWRLAVADRVDAIVADEASVFFTGHGATSRSREKGPLVGRAPLADAGRRLAASRPSWLRRVGGSCEARPVLHGRALLAPCLDDYVHAVERRRGLEVWRTDLPARLLVEPVVSPGRLDCVLAPTGYVVALAPDNGAVLGWAALADADETFLGPAARVERGVVAATSLGRVVALEWTWDALPEDDGTKGPRLRPGEESITDRRDQPKIKRPASITP